MIALARMRLAGFLRGGRALAPLITVLALFSILYGGGASPAAATYGYSAVCLFPILAWLTKLLLDTEPDAQRRLARLALGPVREAAAGLLAALTLAAAVCLFAMVMPWLVGAISASGPGAILLGLLAHLLSIMGAVALGALAGRAVTRRVLPGVAVLVSGSILVIVLGMRDSIAPWLVPPVMAVARELGSGAAPDPARMTLLTAGTALWCAVVLAIYARLRRSRS